MFIFRGQEKDKAGLKVLDLGIHPSYVEAAYEAARAVQAAEQQGLRKMGVICCGSGQVRTLLGEQAEASRV